MQILVASPIPSHPQNHGNRARLFSLCRALQARGHQIHFLYSGFEGLQPEQEIAWRKSWDFVHINSEYVRARKPLWRHHKIDAWYPKKFDTIAKHILGHWKIDACITNYVWLSRWLELVPDHIPTYLDTHDIFANRHQKMKAQGLKPNWFSTSPREEAKALKRADVTFAIQDEEAQYFRSISHKPVAVLGHLLEAQFVKPRPLPAVDQKINLGYMASNNVLNQQALAALFDVFDQNPMLYNRFALHLAGEIGKTAIAERFLSVQNHGFVADAKSFYDQIDLLINPHIGGTGLKIKSVEALSFGMPLLASTAAMIGLPCAHPAHQLKNTQDILLWLRKIAEKPDLLDELRFTGQHVFNEYQKSVSDVIDHFFPPAAAQDPINPNR